MFACMKCSRISRNREIREIFMHANICSLCPATSQFVNFSNRTLKFAKFSCREIFMFYSKWIWIWIPHQTGSPGKSMLNGYRWISQ